MGRIDPRGGIEMFYAPFAIDTKRDPARERLAPLLSDLRLAEARARERGARRLVRRLLPPRRPRAACA
jgi:hypothetical protein